MNQIKRQCNFIRSCDEEVKKLRTTFDEEELSITCLENLSNEIFYEIFDYLDGCDIYKAFSNLNIRFQNLLTHSSLSLKIYLDCKSKSTLESHCRHVIIPNKHHILSLHLKDASLINDFFNHCNVDSSFNRLQSVVLSEVSDCKLMMILFYLNSLSRLFSLTIKLEDDYSHQLTDIYRLIFRLPYLKYNKLSISDYEESDILIPISINEKLSTITYLVIDLCCTVDEISSILYHTPHLQHLTCQRLVETDEIGTKQVLLTLPNLTYVSIASCDIEFDVFEMFIKRISSQLKVLRIKTSSNKDYLDANQWKQLIKKHMPHLCKLHFDHYMDIDNGDDITPNHESINQFTSSFWIARQWFFELKSSIGTLVYSVHPYKKMWFDYDEHEQIITYLDRITDQYTSKPVTILRRQESGKAFNQSIQLTIEGYTSDTWDPAYIDDMKPCFLAVPFTHLDIDCKEIPIDILIEIIRLLPNLDSLKVSSLPLVQVGSLSAEDTEMLLLVSITHKITKVKLNKMDGMEQVHFLMNLCPRMQYLEVGCTTESDLENVVGSISMNNITHIPYLSCLCLCVPDANEKMIQNLDNIIDFERLFHIERAFHNYVIQRIHNKIFLKWNL